MFFGPNPCSLSVAYSRCRHIQKGPPTSSTLRQSFLPSFTQSIGFESSLLFWAILAAWSCYEGKTAARQWSFLQPSHLKQALLAVQIKLAHSVVLSSVCKQEEACALKTHHRGTHPRSFTLQQPFRRGEFVCICTYVSVSWCVFFFFCPICYLSPLPLIKLNAEWVFPGRNPQTVLVFHQEVGRKTGEKLRTKMSTCYVLYRSYLWGVKEHTRDDLKCCYFLESNKGMLLLEITVV